MMCSSAIFVTYVVPTRACTCVYVTFFIFLAPKKYQGGHELTAMLEKLPLHWSHVHSLLQVVINPEP